jgi:geranylgeranyl reductase family protein
MTSTTVDSTTIVDEAEVLVVGAGPAGSSCAARLAELGKEVLLVDKSGFPREKPCGDGLTGASVEALEQFELHHLLRESREVLGLQVFLGDRRRLKPFQRSARCISRFDLDQALLSAALERGARFEQIRVAGLLSEGDAIVGVSTADAGGILARCVIAADGATSRLRRDCGFSPLDPDRRAYAIRQYVRTERPLTPYFDVHIPLMHHSAELLGYGWVFPLDEYTANVGVGFYRSQLTESRSLRAVLNDFIETLEQADGGGYGALEPISDPLGSPLGTGFETNSCQHQRVLFVGDSARMTEPLTGEGIAHAVQGGMVAADAAHAALGMGRGSDWHEDLDLGSQLVRRFLRLGQDFDVLRRAAARRLATPSVHPRLRRIEVRDKPFLAAMAQTVSEPYESPTLERTPVYSLVAQFDGESAAALEEMNESILKEVATPLPLVPEALHLRLRADAGPAAAALTLLTARAGGRSVDPKTVSVAMGTEFLAMFPDLLNQTVDQPSGKVGKFNNVLTILAADYVVSRALRCGAAAGSTIVGAIADTGCSMCEAEAIARVGRDDLRGATACYIRAAQLREGKLFELATIAGGTFADQPAATMTMLRRYGRFIGVAFRISRDICRLLAIDGGAEPGELPPDLIAAAAMAQQQGGIEKVLLECEGRANSAKGAIEEAPVDAALVALASLPVELARSAVGALGDVPSAALG